MLASVRWLSVMLWIVACGESAAPVASAPPPAPTAPAAPGKPSAPSPCADPAPRTLELEAGVIQQTPWGLELTFAIDEDKKLGPGYMFLLRHGDARWETRRDKANWRNQMTWRGFCWRGVDLPERRSSRAKIEIAPVCKDGVLQELGGCGSALGGG
jgi:hypothetical protein